MSRYPHKDLPLKKAWVDPSEYVKKTQAAPGTKKVPAKIVVKSEARRAELAPVFEEHGWTYEITVDSSQDENLAELEFLQNRQPTTVIDKQPGRNDPCHCGSGKKYKKCCGAS